MRGGVPYMIEALHRHFLAENEYDWCPNRGLNPGYLQYEARRH
jgi:hypothetical protein